MTELRKKQAELASKGMIWAQNQYFGSGDCRTIKVWAPLDMTEEEFAIEQEIGHKTHHLTEDNGFVRRWSVPARIAEAFRHRRGFGRTPEGYRLVRVILG